MTSSPDRGRAVTPAELRAIRESISKWQHNCGGCETCFQVFGPKPRPYDDEETLRLLDRIDELEAALRWYANENNWCDTFDDDGVMHLLSSSPAEDDMGHRARVALGEEK